MSSQGLFQRFENVHILDGIGTPMVDYMGAFADANPIDLGIKAARAVIKRADVDAEQIDSAAISMIQTADSDIACFEVNEAQGAQTLAVARELGLDLDKLNVHGGAIALGHPLAATGVRLTITCARQLQAFSAPWGVASACIGGGQGMALLIENMQA